MDKKLAFVLSGGGSHGAMQVGALRALLESGYHPDLVTGSSIGAANGAFLAVHGYTLQGIQMLEQAWRSTIDQDLLPTNLWWQTMQAVFKGAKGFSQQRIREFAITNGLTPDLCFRDIKGIELHPVAADLNAGSQVIFGSDPDELVLESVLASMSLPPWMAPMEQNGRYLVDGGAVSNLPIEAALQLGATEIIALDLFNSDEASTAARGFSRFFLKLDMTVEQRQAQLEMKLAEARGVPVLRVSLICERPVPFWDFRQSVELIERGYHLTTRSIAAWKRKKAMGDMIEGFLEALE